MFGGAILLVVVSCSGGDEAPGGSAATTLASAGGVPDAPVVEVPETTTTQPEATTTLPPVIDFYDASTVHEIVVTFDQGGYDAMIEAFQADNGKDWIEASVTIDGESYRQVGMRLKGNSSLFAIGGRIPGLDFGGPPAGGPPAAAPAEPPPPQPPTSDAPGAPLGGPPLGSGFGGGEVSVDKPESLPWLIRLDKYIEDQNHQGRTEFVVRSNTSKTGLNEAVALSLLGEIGLANQSSAMVRFTVNGGEKLRLVVDNPNDRWMADALDESGKLYKADNSGDYSYLGDDPDAYKDVFKQEAGDDDLRPLIEFLDFVNNSTDDEFAASLAERLDVAAFARYLAFEDAIVRNFDTIDGPGNNSYLYFDPASKRMTVVAWDHNLALGVSPFGVGDATNAGGFDPANMPADFPIKFSGNNILTVRFKANNEFAAMITAETLTLTAEIIDSGVADDVLGEWTQLLEQDATALVPLETIRDESQRVATFFAPA
jgi:spore coat protein CotH